MNRMTLAAVVAALVAVFAVLTVSVVNARRPLDEQVKKSFRTVVSHASGSAFGCAKTRVNFYDCSALMRPPLGGREQQIHYTLWLRDDGCWHAKVTSLALRRRFRALDGCIASSF
jgi:hypothetical protein